MGLSCNLEDPVKIKRLQDEHQVWDEYVQRNGKTSFFHQIGWKNVVQKTFRHQPYYLFAEENGRMCGILPLFLVKSVLFGKFFVSVPFASYGGVCADSQDIETLLIEEAMRMAEDEHVDYLELRNRWETKYFDFKRKDLYVTFQVDLHEDPDILWKSLRKKARTAVRKGIKSGLKAEMNVNRTKEFYNVFSRSYRNLGSPVFSLRYIDNLLDEFKDQATILCVDYDDKMIAGILTFFTKDTIIPYYGGSLPGYLEYSPNNFKCWELMKYGCENGYRYCDFGRSRIDSGSYHFKKNFGFTPETLYYQYYLIGRKDIPFVSPSNPKYHLPSKIWRRLPLSVTKIVGPKIVKNIP